MMLRCILLSAPCLCRKIAEQLQKTSVIWGNTLEADILKKGRERIQLAPLLRFPMMMRQIFCLPCWPKEWAHYILLPWVNMPGFVPLISALGVDG